LLILLVFGRSGLQETLDIVVTIQFSFASTRWRFCNVNQPFCLQSSW